MSFITKQACSRVAFTLFALAKSRHSECIHKYQFTTKSTTLFIEHTMSEMQNLMRWQ